MQKNANLVTIPIGLSFLKNTESRKGNLIVAFWRCVTYQNVPKIAKLVKKSEDVEAVTRRCLVKRCFKKFRKIHSKTHEQKYIFNKAAGFRPATSLKRL